MILKFLRMRTSNKIITIFLVLLLMFVVFQAVKWLLVGSVSLVVLYFLIK